MEKQNYTEWKLAEAKRSKASFRETQTSLEILTILCRKR